MIMTVGLILPTCCIFFSTLLLIVFFSKDRINLLENKIYGNMIIVNFVSLLMEFLCTFYAYHSFSIFMYIVVRLYLIILIIWIFLLSLYICTVTKKDSGLTDDDAKKTFPYYLLIAFVGCICSSVFPINVFVSRFGASADGLGVKFVFFTSIVFQVLCFYNLFKSRKNVGNKKYIPIVIYFTIGQFIFLIQSWNPGLLLVTPTEMFVTMIMYFTIENPDIKLIRELNVAKERADKANSAKTDFLSNMSHEIRTPLNAIVGLSNHLLEQDIPDKSKDDIKDIIAASDNLLEIVNGILDISKIEADKLELVDKEYNVYSMFKELNNLSKARLGEKPIDFRVKIDESIPATLYGDATRIKQVVINLLTNAIKYTKDGFIEFKVDHVIVGDMCRLIMSVEDSGIGIKNENIDRLFSKFERFDLEKNITIEGTGLGLAITKKLVDLMKGKIVVQSMYGKGSKFTVSIDQKIVKGKEHCYDEDVVKDVEYFDLSDKRILVVDDNRLNLKVASKMLEPYNIVIDTCQSGEECINKINSGELYDLILMDDMMPKMSGTETLKKLKDNDSFNIHVVVLTANAIEGMKDKYIGDGFDDYLSKPIDKNELNRVLDKFLNGFSGSE